MSDGIYCYADSDVLKNRMGINPIQGKFDLKHLQSIHYYIFQDVYEWAGKIRKVDIAKGNMFCNVKFIEKQARIPFYVITEEWRDYLPNALERKMNISSFVTIVS